MQFLIIYLNASVEILSAKIHLVKTNLSTWPSRKGNDIIKYYKTIRYGVTRMTNVHQKNC